MATAAAVEPASTTTVESTPAAKATASAAKAAASAEAAAPAVEAAASAVETAASAVEAAASDESTSAAPVTAPVKASAPIAPAEAMEPRPSTNKHAAYEPVWSIETVGRAIIRVIRVIPIGANRRNVAPVHGSNPNTNTNLRLGRRRSRKNANCQ
jgi:hypothetical protein